VLTFGRDHEKACGAEYVRDKSQVGLLSAVIDAVHDRIEGTGDDQSVAVAVEDAFVNGGNGVWENAGTWLRKASVEWPELLHVWALLAAHPKGEVRFRVACFLRQIPTECRESIATTLVSDRSKRVRSMARSRIMDDDPEAKVS